MNLNRIIILQRGHVVVRVKILLGIMVLLLSAFAQASEIVEIEEELSDALITTKITAKYTQNNKLNPLKIHVKTHDKTVFLSGHVKDKDAFVTALKLALNTKGVKTIDAESLYIQQVNTGLTDAYITTKVEAAVLKAKVLEDESIPLVGINARTENGVVTLSGKVKTAKTAAAILKYVVSVKGVKKVISELEVNEHYEV
jgi:hyperosmotically inducible protein